MIGAPTKLVDGLGWQQDMMLGPKELVNFDTKRRLVNIEYGIGRMCSGNDPATITLSVNVASDGLTAGKREIYCIVSIFGRVTGKFRS